MIQANELRIGNWVYYGESMRTITAIGNSPQRKFIGVDNLITELHIIKPIPLSTEILLKCGFKSYDNHENRYTVYGNHGDDSDIFLEYDWVNRDVGYIPMIKSGEYETVGNQIKYLHQLQNLIFALTENELNIQL